MEYNEQINIRLSKTDKEKINLVLKEINKTKPKKVGYRFLIMEFVNNYLDNNITGLEIEKNQLLKELEIQKENKNKISENISDLEIKIKKIDHELNNKSLYDLSNYQYNDNINHAINRIKEFVLTKKDINNLTDIPGTLYKQMETTFKINEKDLLKNIVNVEFNKWIHEKEINNLDLTPEPTKEDIIKEIADKLLNKFNRYGQHIKILKDYLNQKQTKQLIQTYLNNQDKDINENDIINYLLSLPENKQRK